MPDGRFAIVASEYNGVYVDAMIEGARAVFQNAGVAAVELARAPGAFEIPVVAARLAARKRSRPEAIVCLGVILRGQTEHARLIAEAVSFGLAKIQIENLVPTVHEVLLLENHAQARARCLPGRHNRGAEAAQTALRMAALLRQLK